MATETNTNELPPTTSEEISIDERRKNSFEYTKSFLLGKRIKTTLSDGRTLTGKFICIDRLKNLILTNVIEERFIDPSDYRYRVGDGDRDEMTDGYGNGNEMTDGNGDGDEMSNGDDDDDREHSMDRRIRVERHISQAMIPGSRLVKAEILLLSDV